MPFCLKCGRELVDEARFCISCGVSSAAQLRKSQIGRRILLGFVLLDLLAAGALMFFLFQSQAPILKVTPTPTETRRPPLQPPQTTTLTPNISPPNSPPAPTEGEENRIREMLVLFFDALNRHSVDEVVIYFSDEVEILINHGKDYSYRGSREDVKQYLLVAFTLAPDAEIKEVNISSLEVGDYEAKVQVTYLVSPKRHNLSRTVFEQFELARENNLWKIARTDIVY